jgi:hypothetical protein
MTSHLHCIFHRKGQQLRRLFNIAEAVEEVLKRAGNRITDAVLLIRQYFMEHVCSASFEVEGVLRFIKDLLVFLHIEWLLFDEDCAFDTEGVNEIANFLARANESSDFADPG